MDADGDACLVLVELVLMDEHHRGCGGEEVSLCCRPACGGVVLQPRLKDLLLTTSNSLFSTDLLRFFG